MFVVDRVRSAVIAGLAVGLAVAGGTRLMLRAQATGAQQGAQGQRQPLLLEQSEQMAQANSKGCITCHTNYTLPLRHAPSDALLTDEATMHATGTVLLGCIDCHGGNADKERGSAAPGSREYINLTVQAHRNPPSIRARAAGGSSTAGETLSGVRALAGKAREHGDPYAKAAADPSKAANPVEAYTDWLKQDIEYIQFVNPGDLRVADRTCGRVGCHKQEVYAVRNSMMTHGAMLWGAALYNNGAVPFKNPRFGESYGPDGEPQKLESCMPAPAGETATTCTPPTAEQTRAKGILPYLEPLQRWEVAQPGNVLRVFERGGGPRQEIGNPELDEDPGRPDVKLSDRGFGTELRTDPVFLGLQKTRLLDPLLSLPGTNDHPGDYRASGCSACHVVYANDKAAEHSGPYATYGHDGFTVTNDPTMHKGEHGHPIRHQFTRAIPSSQCMVCHMHPGTNMVTTYFGYTWWDNEIDGASMYPKQQHDPSYQDLAKSEKANPEDTAARGLWSKEDFLEKTGSDQFNKNLKRTNFADFHSHGWIFRAVYKQDRHGNLLDKDGVVIPTTLAEEERLSKKVQLADIHLVKGMHCIDCHFQQDNHGNGLLYGETRNAVEISCTDCHGTIQGRSTLTTSAAAAPEGGTSMARLTTPWKERRFYWKGDCNRDDPKAPCLLYQRSMLEQGKEWEVIQVADTITPGRPHYNEKARLAKTMQTDGQTWGAVPQDSSKLAHRNEKMTCFACHSSWTTSCFGCHLSMVANERRPMLHNEGLITRNWTSYDFQVLRDDVYMLGIDGTPTGNKVAPIRSACAVLVSSQNQNRDWIYYQQQTISAEGYSGQSFSPYMPHTVGGTQTDGHAKETRECTDCHVSKSGDNNAWMAQLLIQGTGLVNQIGRYVYVAEGKHGYEAVTVAEHTEPTAVIGSDFQEVVYPRNFEEFKRRGRRLTEADGHSDDEVLDVQLRGEYLYAALGKRGFRAYDVANIDDKDFSEKMTTAPVSPLGQKFYVKTKYAMSVASPSTLAVDPLRRQRPENEEQLLIPADLMYGFLYVADKYEGLIVIGNNLNDKKNGAGVGTLLDGDPNDNFLRRARLADGSYAYNPLVNGARQLDGARRIAFAGTYAYILSDRGLVVVDLKFPIAPVYKTTIPLRNPTGIAIQFRYAFVTDSDGLKVLDITNLDNPVLVDKATVRIPNARNVYVARTYAYVSAGPSGMALVDVENPEQSPKTVQFFNANGAMNDTNDIKIGMTSGSAFAYVADGRNGMRIVQLFSPSQDATWSGFSPVPRPKLIATYRTRTPALAISRGIDRDRAVDESGNQLAVFGRRGAHPFNPDQLHRMYLHNGQLYTVTDDPADYKQGLIGGTGGR